MSGKYHKTHVELQSHLLRDFHSLMLQALRQREQDVIRYIAILAPAIGGYVWLLTKYKSGGSEFVTGTIGVMFLLLTGAIYAVHSNIITVTSFCNWPRLRASSTLGFTFWTVGLEALRSLPKSMANGAIHRK